MGGGSQSSTSTVTLSPEQRDVLKKVQSSYTDSNGNFVNRPSFDPQDMVNRGTKYTAPLNQYHNAAIDTTTQAANSYAPYQQTATGAAMNSGNTYNGQQQSQQWNTQNVAQYMNPYTQLVQQTGLNELSRANQLNQMATNDQAVKAGAFGGTRQAVQNAENDRNFLSQAQNFIANTGNQAFTNAQGQFNTSNQQALQDNTFNRDTTYNNNTQQNQFSQLMMGLGNNEQARGLQSATALRDAGDIQRNYLQTLINSGQGDVQSEADWAGRVGQLINSFTPPPSTTTTTSGGGGNAGIGIGLSLIGGLLSDPKSKKNVKDEDPENVLKQIKGLTSKTFEYNDKARAMGAPAGRITGTMADSYEKNMGTELPTVGEYKAIPMADTVGKLLVAVKGLTDRTEHLVKKSPAAKKKVAHGHS